MTEQSVSGTRIVAWVLKGGSWESSGGCSSDQAIGLINDADRLVWVDVEGDPAGLKDVMGEITDRCGELFHGIDPTRATEGGDNPPRLPPKVKAFRNCVFARVHWLGTATHTAPSTERHLLLAREVHVLAGNRSVVTLRYPCLEWDLDAGDDMEPTRHALTDAGPELDKIRVGVTELRDRRHQVTSEDLFGLDLTTEILGHVVDSLFTSVDGLRGWTDGIEQEVLAGRWLWARRTAEGPPSLDNRLLRLGRLVRHIRWAFLPDDEIDEFLSGPFLDVQDASVQFAFRDLEREATRAIATVKDLADQVQHVVEHRNTMKTDRLNDTTYVLTAVATILLIPTLIAGIYGMNFRNIPELNWRLGYFGALAAMVLLGAGIWLGIRRYLRNRSNP